MRKKILITGATGYIGEHLTRLLISNGFHVNALVRNPSALTESEQLSVFPYQFGHSPNVSAFNAVYAVVHLAANTETEINENQEILAARQLLEAAKHNGVKCFIYLSSQSATVDAQTVYGLNKWKIEQAILNAQGLIIRPGLVYGGAESKGLFATLCRVARKSPVLPGFRPALRVQPIHIQELCAAILTILSRSRYDTNVFNIASNERIDISYFIQQIAWSYYRRHLFVIPIPVFLLTIFSRLLSTISIRGFDPERINGLLNLKKMSTIESLNDLELVPCRVSQGLGFNKVKYRDLVNEGHALLSYVSDRKAANHRCLRLYVRAIESLNDGKVLDINYIYLAYPCLLRLVDPHLPIINLGENIQAELKTRIEIVISILEVDPSQQELFRLERPKNLFSTMFSLSLDIAREIVLVPAMIINFLKSIVNR